MKRERGPFTCRGCGAAYCTKRSKGEGEKYCSRACAFSDAKAWHRAGEATARPWHSEGPSCKVCFRSCAACAKPFAARWSTQKACSEACGYTLNLASKRERYDAARAHKWCAWCGEGFEGHRRRVYCCGSCAKRADGRNHIERAKRYGVPYERINERLVLERHGWRCQICGHATPASLRGSEQPFAPELDHIIAMSRGGPHLYENVQCACRRCNGIKGDGNLRRGPDGLFYHWPSAQAYNFLDAPQWGSHPSAQRP